MSLPLNSQRSVGVANDAERSAEAIDQARWMHTGDLATLDEEGYCNIVGRIKDMVIRGGENVYPREIEEVLLGQPGVREAAVAGVPDEYQGEAVKAWVVLREGERVTVEELRAYCKERLAGVVDQISRGHFPPRVGRRCVWCRVKAMCPVCPTSGDEATDLDDLTWDA